MESHLNGFVNLIPQAALVASVEHTFTLDPSGTRVSVEPTLQKFTRHYEMTDIYRNDASTTMAGKLMNLTDQGKVQGLAFRNPPGGVAAFMMEAVQSEDSRTELYFDQLKPLLGDYDADLTQRTALLGAQLAARNHASVYAGDLTKKDTLRAWLAMLGKLWNSG